MEILERDHYKFRSKARIVAFVDLILSSMSLCLCLIFFIGLLRISTMDERELVLTRQKSINKDADSSILAIDPVPKSGGGGDSPMEGSGSGGDSPVEGININTPHLITPKTTTTIFPTDPAFVKIMWTFLALICIMTGVQILAAIRLLNATQLGKDPIGAMKLCRFWRIVCAFFTALLVFNFLSAFRQRGENFFEVSFLMSSILIRTMALYVVIQYMKELEVTIVTTLPIHRIHHPTSSHLPPSFNMGDNMVYAYAGGHGQFSCPIPMPSGTNHAPPPKYEDVVKTPYKGPGATGETTEA